MFIISIFPLNLNFQTYCLNIILFISNYSNLLITKNKQASNGAGCAYYALNNINPDDNTKKYWQNLP